MSENKTERIDLTCDSPAPTSPKGKAPRRPLGCGVTFEEDMPPAKKPRIGGDDGKTYETLAEWIAAEGAEAVYKNVKARYNPAWGVESFVKWGEDETDIKTWEQYDHWVREVGDDESDTLLEQADNMVKLIRDQNDLIEVLRAQLEKKD